MNSESLNSESAPINPFQSPHSESGGADASGVISWKEIAIRWERLRWPFNLMVGTAGMFGLILITHEATPAEIVGGAIGWAIGANVCYLLGPVLQMYACWFAESKWLGTAPTPAEALAGSQLFTWVFFLAGAGFSILLTLATVLFQGELW